MRYKFNSKTFFALMSLLLIVGLVAACGGAETPTSAPAEVEAPAEEEAPVEEEAMVEKVAPAEEEAAAPSAPSASVIELPAVDPLAVSGDIISAGSSTVFPLSERMAERFLNEGYSGQITIDSIGSGAGFSRFCEAGETDISNASRPIKAARRPTRTPAGRAYRVLRHRR